MSTEKKQRITVKAPGRINLIGEHTDYNEGFVLPAAIDRGITLHLERKTGEESTCDLHARNLDRSFSFDLRNFGPQDGGWANYLLGVVHELQQLGAAIEPFSCSFSGDVPIGSGMSSSAALECSMALALNELFDLQFDKMTLIKAAQMAEHHFVGTKCGIMDQFASMMGQKDQVLLLDCRTLEYQYFPSDLGNYSLLLLNTNVSPSLASSEYNTRRAECEEGVRILQQHYPQIKALRDVAMKQLLQHKEEMPDKVYLRCRHIISENERVLQATKALQEGAIDQLGVLMFQSHYSLRDQYEVSCPELDFLVGQAEEKDYIAGARMMGGGFGGCTINLIESGRQDAFIEDLAAQYRSRFGLELTPYQVSIEHGAHVVADAN